MSRPNILLLMTDQQRWDSLGVYGAPEACTPNLDRLAREGARFDRAYCNNPICTPSRSSLLTGGELPDHGVMHLEDILDDDQVLVSERIQSLGYRTALFGKLHVSAHRKEACERHPHDGFDIYEWCHEPAIHVDSPFNGYGRWLAGRDPVFRQELLEKGRKIGHFPSENHATRWTAEAVNAFLREQNEAKPFFCFASVFDPHDPYDDYPLEYGERIPNEHIRPALKDRQSQAMMPRGIQTERAMSYLGSAPEDPTAIRELRRGYHASVAMIDEQFGRILDCLEETGLAENTLVIFTSDHGDMLGDHSLMGKGAFFYEPCVRVPLLMRWPNRIEQGTVRCEPIQLNDLAATFCEAAGMDDAMIRAVMPQARSLLPLVTGTTDQAPRESVICAYRHTGYGRGSLGSTYIPVSATMIREGDFKLCLYHDESGNDLAAEGQLFDLANDPDELNNLWGCPRYASAQQRLSAKIINWINTREGGLTRFTSDEIPVYTSAVAL